MVDRVSAGLVEGLAYELAKIGRLNESPTLFYAEAGDGWAGGSVYVDRGDRIEWVSPEDEVIDPVMTLWARAPEDKKWRGMTMFVDGSEYRLEYDYGEGWLPDQDEGDRREPIVRARFGDKPIYYPPLEGAGPWE